METSPIRGIFQCLAIIVAVLALPATLTAQTTSATSAASSIVELPDAPMVAALTSDSVSVFGRDAYFRANATAIPVEPALVVNSTPRENRSHRFWDCENAVLFSAVGSMAAADFYVTHANLASGGKELNPVTRVFAGSTPALAANFALETTGVMAVSYLFHKTGHHRLERATSLFSIGGSSTAVAYDLIHR
jgi:hypothetical protein